MLTTKNKYKNYLKTFLFGVLVFGIINISYASSKTPNFNYEKTSVEANTGDVYSMLALVNYYFENKKPNKMRKWAKKAADLGNARAQWLYASILMWNKEYDQAIKYVKLSLRQRYIVAMGYAWAGVFKKLPPEYQTNDLREEFLKYTKEACNLKLRSSCYILGGIYSKGEAGVKINKQEAIKWYKKDLSKIAKFRLKQLGEKQ